MCIIQQIAIIQNTSKHKISFDNNDCNHSKPLKEFPLAFWKISLFLHNFSSSLFSSMKFYLFRVYEEKKLYLNVVTNVNSCPSDENKGRLSLVIHWLLKRNDTIFDLFEGWWWFLLCILLLSSLQFSISFFFIRFVVDVHWIGNLSENCMCRMKYQQHLVILISSLRWIYRIMNFPLICDLYGILKP